jgi:hypothetical protein
LYDAGGLVTPPPPVPPLVATIPDG